MKKQYYIRKETDAVVFVTGDTHFPIDGNKLFKEQSGFPFSTLQRSDYVIVLGDFGLFWKKQDKHNAKNMPQIHALPYTLLFSSTATMRTSTGSRNFPSSIASGGRCSDAEKISWI